MLVLKRVYLSDFLFVLEIVFLTQHIYYGEYKKSTVIKKKVLPPYLFYFFQEEFTQCALCYTVLSVLVCITLHYTVGHCTTLYYTKINCNLLYYSVLHCSTL